MNKKKTFKITSGINDAILFWRIFLGCFPAFIAFFFGRLAFQLDDISFITLGISFLFGLFALLAFRIVFTINKYELEDEKLTVKSVFNYVKKTICIDEIVSYAEIEYGGYVVLVLFTKKTKVKLPSTMTNYVQFKAILTENKPLHPPLQKIAKSNFSDKRPAIWAIIPLLIGLWFIKMGVNNFITRDDDFSISKDQTKTISLTINTIDIDRGKNSNLYITVTEYPKYSFGITGTMFLATKVDDVEVDISIDNKVEIDILKTEYEKRISKTKEITLLEKGINSRSFSIYGLRKNGKEYLSLESINKASKSNKSSLFGLFFSVGGGLFLVLCGTFWIAIVFQD